MNRCFEKISFNQFKKDVKNDEVLYNSYSLPTRKTSTSAGYDFEIIEDLVLQSKEIKKVPTGIKARMQSDELLMIYIRSSVGFKHNVRLTNQTGIIDSDYYNNANNEGHIWLSIQNESDEVKVFKKGDAIAQGIFMKYLTVDNEEKINIKRLGGIGSTSKKEENK